MKRFKTIKPLSNFDIIKLCKEELKINNFKGCFMRDGLPAKRTTNECMILNLDDNKGPGTHWTSLYIKNNQALYFDPFGLKYTDELQTYLDGIPTYYNTFAIQKPDEVICGHYCIYVLWRLDNHERFYDILLELL